MVACSESHESGVVRWRWDGDGAGAADVSVAQLVGEELQLVGSEAVVIPEDVVVGRTTGSLRTDGSPSAPGSRLQERNMEKQLNPSTASTDFPTSLHCAEHLTFRSNSCSKK